MEYPQANISKQTWWNLFKKASSGAYSPSQKYINVVEVKEKDTHHTFKKKTAKQKPQGRMKKA